MIRSFYLLMSLLLITCISCNDQKIVEVPPPEQECKILSPISGQMYSPDNPMHLIAKYDIMLFSALRWEYSLDNGITWFEMITERNDAEQDYGSDPIYAFDVKQWTPIDNTIEDTVVWIKGSAYAGTKFVIKENIRIKR